jgi:sigma-54-interacting transcriptional regulator
MDTEDTRSLPHWHATESLLLQTRRHNVLIEGPAEATSAALLQMRPHIHEPIVWKPPQAPLELPGSEPSALILENIAALSAEEQVRLLAWLGGHRARTRVVSTTERPLFAFVTSGDFDRRLYYRLNIVLLQIGQRR